MFPEKFLFCTDTTGSIEWPSRGLRFDLVLDFRLAWSTCLTVLSVQHVHLTQLLDRNLSLSWLVR